MKRWQSSALVAVVIGAAIALVVWTSLSGTPDEQSAPTSIPTTTVAPTAGGTEPPITTTPEEGPPPGLRDTRNPAFDDPVSRSGPLRSIRKAGNYVI